MTDWKPIETCPKVKDNPLMDFRFKDGKIIRGKWAPYWCGSDCPCYDLDEGPTGIFSAFPECWGVYLETSGIDDEPLVERPIEWAAV